MSRDDPFVAALPVEECAANGSTLLAVTAAGGHVGYLGGHGLNPFRLSWMDTVLVEFMAAALAEAGGAPPPPPLKSRL